MASEANLRQRDIELGCASYGDFEMVVDVDGFDEFIDQHSTLCVRCSIPKCVYVDLGEVCGDLVEAIGRVG
jgi:hypothetical protein